MPLPPDLDRGPVLGATIVILIVAICSLLVVDGLPGFGTPGSASAQEVTNSSPKRAVTVVEGGLEGRLRSLADHLSRFEKLLDEYIAASGADGGEVLQAVSWVRGELEQFEGSVGINEGSPGGSAATRIQGTRVLSGPPSAVCGPPDTEEQGSHTNAWSPRQADRGWEWIEVDFAEPIHPESVIVVENFNPGAIVKIERLAVDGQWVEIWSGNDTATDETPELWIECPEIEATSTVRVILDTTRIPGFNQIDAVGVLSRGEVVWGTSARASSSLH